MRIVTGYTGTPHITSNDDQGLLQGIFGTGGYILPVRSKFAATLISANEVQIGDGEGVFQGVHFRIEPETTESVTIENGSQGMSRIDLICVRYEKDVDTGVESVSLVVLKGTPAASSPTAPTPTTGNILEGDLLAEMPLYKVEIVNLAVDSVALMASVEPSISTLNNKLRRTILTENNISVAANGYTDVTLTRTDGGIFFGATVRLTATANAFAVINNVNATQIVVRIRNVTSNALSGISVDVWVISSH